MRAAVKFTGSQNERGCSSVCESLSHSLLPAPPLPAFSLWDGSADLHAHSARSKAALTAAQVHLKRTLIELLAKHIVKALKENEKDTV